jgi:hypothetical protein
MGPATTTAALCQEAVVEPLLELIRAAETVASERIAAPRPAEASKAVPSVGEEGDANKRRL